MGLDGVKRSEGSYCCQRSPASQCAVQITLLVLGILALTLGYVYLKDVERIVTMSAGGLAIALAVIGRCCFMPAPPRVLTQDEKDLMEKEKKLKDSELGRALLKAIADKKAGVGQVCQVPGELAWASSDPTYRVTLKCPAVLTLYLRLTKADTDTPEWRLMDKSGQDATGMSLFTLKKLPGILNGTDTDWQLVPEGSK